MLLLCCTGVLRVHGNRLSTTAREIHHLNPVKAAQHEPVQVTGVVTAFSGWRNSFFLQDATSGISVNRKSQFPELRPGDRVVVEGVTDPGAFAPQVSEAEVRLLAHGTLPSPLVVTAADLAWGVQDSRYVAVRGEVRSVEHRQVWGRDRLILSMNIGAPDPVAVYVYADSPKIEGKALVGATVTVRGVCGTIWTGHRQFAGLRLFATAAADIKVEYAAPADPFDVPFRNIEGLLQYGRTSDGTSQLKIEGTVSAILPGSGFYLQDRTGGTFVSDKADAVKPGTRLEVIGYPSLKDTAPMLQATHVRQLGGAQKLVPAVIADAGDVFVSDRGFISSPYEFTIVELTGRLLEYLPGTRGGTLLLTSGGILFRAFLPDSEARDALKVGSLLRLRGVCIVSAKEDTTADSFHLLLRSADDISVIQRAPWWTIQHALWLTVALGILLLAMFGWVALLRRQARLQALVTTDPLTGLYNRRGFLLLAQKQIELLQRRNGSFLLFYFDVNRFKQINDTYGHREGDCALRDVAAVLRQVFRDGDVLCRLGGDEFAVLATDAPSDAEIMLKGRLLEALTHMNRTSGKAYHLSLSVGALFCDRACLQLSIEDLLERADALMYSDKRNVHATALPAEA